MESENATSSGPALLARGWRLQALLDLEAALARPEREGVATFAAVYCDGCGTILKARSVDELAELTAARGWRITPPDAIGPDLCGHCQ